MSNMKQIARLANVSTATVSHVLSGKKPVKEETRRRVEEAIRQTDYTLNTIAKSLRMNKTQTIGVLAEDIRGLPVPEIVTGISEYLEMRGYQLLLNNLRLLEKLYNQYDHIAMCQDEINQGMKVLLDAHVDGIIYVAMHDRSLDGVLMPVDKPLVYAYAKAGEKSGLYVTYDNKLSAAAITRCLIKKGHIRIAVIAGHHDSDPSRQRLNGFLETMEEAGLSVPQEYIRWGDWESPTAAAQT
jgi:LacI family transcriptional regulator